MKRITSYVDDKPIYDKETAMSYANYLVSFIKNQVKNAGANGAVVGISGGIDSALTIHLAKLALGKENILGVIMPIDNMEHDLLDIKKLENSLNIKFLTVNLGEANNQINKQLNIKNELAKANIKPRLRMTTLYALAQEKKYLVLGTDNYDEVYIGYFTKHGDGGADVLPISKLTKGEVRFLSSILGVPQDIINKKPSAGLWENQSDEDELGFTYNELDYFLDHLDQKEKIKKRLSFDKIQKINKLHINSQHKRDGAYAPLDILEIKY